jgi:hypothetical protein
VTLATRFSASPCVPVPALDVCVTRRRRGCCVTEQAPLAIAESKVQCLHVTVRVRWAPWRNSGVCLPPWPGVGRRCDSPSSVPVKASGVERGVRRDCWQRRRRRRRWWQQQQQQQQVAALVALCCRDTSHGQAVRSRIQARTTRRAWPRARYRSSGICYSLSCPRSSRTPNPRTPCWGRMRRGEGGRGKGGRRGGGGLEGRTGGSCGV